MNTNAAAKTVLCYGDSNTWGQMSAHKGRYPADARWTGVLQKSLGEEYYIIEEGLSSRTTDLDYSGKPGRNGRTYLLPCLDSHRPLDLIILMLGTNDFKIEFNRSAKAIAQAVQGLVQLTHDRLEGKTRVLLVSPILVDDTKPVFQERYTSFYNHDSVIKSQQLGGLLEAVARETDCTFVDASAVAEAGEDGIHFTKESHDRLGTLLAQKVKEMRLL